MTSLEVWFDLEMVLCGFPFINLRIFKRKNFRHFFGPNPCGVAYHNELIFQASALNLCVVPSVESCEDNSSENLTQGIQ